MDNIDWKDFLFGFEGRINRAKFWIGLILIQVVVWIFFMLAVVTDASVMWGLSVLVGLALIWPGVAISIKRWHDRGKSGWWIFIYFVPFIGWLWALIEPGFLPGTPGTNEYGPDPLAGV